MIYIYTNTKPSSKPDQNEIKLISKKLYFLLILVYTYIIKRRFSKLPKKERFIGR